MDEADLGEFERMGGPQLALAVGLYLGGFAASTEPQLRVRLGPAGDDPCRGSWAHFSKSNERR